MKRFQSVLLACLCAGLAHAAGVPQTSKTPAKAASSSALPAAASASIPMLPLPELDVQLRYYSKVLTAEGVQREARYEEKLLRRTEGNVQHLWQTRVLPANTQAKADKDEHAHLHFNPVLLARHLVLENGKLRLEYVNPAQKEVVAIPSTEYDNVNFDGSWSHAAYLADPKAVQALPLLKRDAPAGAEWRERNTNGQFLRVLWDKQKQIALIVEQGDLAGTVFHRLEAIPAATLASARPWQQTRGFAQKEYADYLD